ncbi:MAG: M48 family metalloprotease [Ignavibacteria bacterium]|nr:M48 family metalloprotease [Ignavibacteria bacterium]
MNSLQTLLPATFTDALGWTLLHSLWQGTLIAFTLGVVMIVLRRSSARARSLAASIALLTTMVLTCLTFIALYEPLAIDTAALEAASTQMDKSSSGISSPDKAQVTDKSSPTDNTLQAAPQKGFRALRFAPLNLSREAVWLDRVREYLPALVLVWLLGAICLALRFLGGMVYAQRMKHFRAHPASAEWQHRVAELAERLELRRAPLLVESGLANAPMLVGFLKPMILVPMGFLTGLQTAHIEAIIAHELAHARYQDYLMSILQAVIETVMFYHPAVWWMSAQVRQEREHAADDLAADLCGDSRALAHALAILEERSLVSDEAHFATAGVGANDGHLLTRVKRLLGKPTERSFSLEYLAAYLVITSIFALSLTASPVLQPVVKPFVEPMMARAQEAASNLVSRISPLSAPSAPEAPSFAANASAPSDSNTTHSFWSDDNSISAEGFWEAKFKEKSLTLIISKNKWGRNHYNGTMYNRLGYDEVQGLEASRARTLSGEIEFRLPKESGTFVFKGDAKNGEARGNYSFQPNKDFSAKLTALGYKDVDERDLVAMAVTDVKLDELRELAGLELSTKDAIEVAILGIKPNFVREARKLGLNGEEIREYGVLGIKTDYIADMKSKGYKLDEIKELGVLGIKPEYVEEMKKLGIKSDEIKEYGVLGIRPNKVKELKDAGVPAEEIKEYGVLGINPEYVAAMKALGYKVEDIKEVGVLGIKPEMVKEYKEAGVPVDEIKEYGVLGIRVGYIKEMKALGYKVEDIKEVGVLGIKPEMVKEYKEAGVPVSEIKEYGVLGIRVGYIKEMKALGYKVEDIKEVGVLGIKPETVKAYKNAGLKVDDIKDFAILGIKPDFVKQMRAKGFSAEDIKDFGVRGMSLESISSMRDAGWNREEISDFGSRGIKPQYVKEMKAHGFSKDEIEELGSRGIKAETAKEFKALGFSADDIAEIAVRGIKPETAKELKKLGFSTDDIAELGVRGTRLSTIQKLKAEGLSNKRIVEILTDRD